MNGCNRIFTTGLLLTTQFALWTACSLAVFGVFWRTVPFEPRILFFGFFVALAAVAELIWWKRPSSPSPLNEEEYDEEEFDGSATQQITRFRTEKGTDRLEGTFLVEFIPKQRMASVHVPFCPAFIVTPAVEALLLGGEAALTVVKPQPFGVRIDVKRLNDEPVRILVVAERQTML